MKTPSRAELVEIVRACLSINSSERLAKQELEVGLLERLAKMDKHILNAKMCRTDALDTNPVSNMP